MKRPVAQSYIFQLFVSRSLEIGCDTVYTVKGEVIKGEQNLSAYLPFCVSLLITVKGGRVLNYYLCFLKYILSSCQF